MTQIQNSAHKMKMSTVPFVGDILPEPGAMVISEHDGHLYYADKFGWHKGDTEYNDLIFFVKYDGGDQFRWRFAAPIGTSFTLDWGDGTSTVVAGNDAAVVTTLSNYAEPGVYTFRFQGNREPITKFILSGASNAWVTGDVARLFNMTNLTQLTLGACDVYGSFDGIRNLTALTSILIYDLPNVTGDLSNLSTITLPNTYSVYQCPGLTWDMVSDFGALDGKDFRFYLLDLDSGMVNNALASLKNVTDSIVNLYGNDPRGVNSNPDLIQMIGNGDTIICNELKPVGELGDELYTVSSSISDPAGNESNSIDGWTATGLDAPNVFEPDIFDRAKGNSSFFIDADPDPAAGANITITSPIASELAALYRYLYNVKHKGMNGTWAFYVNDALINNIYPRLTPWLQIVIYVPADGVELELKFAENSGNNNGGIYLDNLSVRKVTLP